MHECELTTGEIRDRVTLRSRNPLNTPSLSTADSPMLPLWSTRKFGFLLGFLYFILFYFFRNLLNTVCDTKKYNSIV